MIACIKKESKLKSLNLTMNKDYFKNVDLIFKNPNLLSKGYKTIKSK